MSAILSPSEDLVGRIEHSIAEEFPSHPFEATFGQAQLLRLLRGFAGMSEAFPYVMARAYSSHVLDAIAGHQPLGAEAAITAAVGSFLCWDEMGGHSLSLREGNEGLPKIIETHRRTHSSLLLADLHRLSGETIKPEYSPATLKYLAALEAGLGSPDPVMRCAHMVAFEFHAERIISALWKAVGAVFDVDPDDLLYFHIHVGGDDPAEKYHMEMTARMIDKLVPQHQLVRFNDMVRQAYALNVEWSAAVASTQGERWMDGQCHCGALRFRALIHDNATAYRCNCSICKVNGFIHLRVPEPEFQLLKGDDEITEYRFNTMTARHMFCRVCGVKPFYRPRSNPTEFTVNMNCLTGDLDASIQVRDFDGVHWEASIGLHADLTDPK